MHACGHDGHMAMLLGASVELAEHGGFDGTLRVVFQPAEEPGKGAQAMVAEGLFERFGMDEIYGIHNLPGYEVGHVLLRSDPIKTAVVSCTNIETDGARNAIPTRVTITGDTRSFEPGVQEILETRIREISTGIASAHGATAEVTYTHEFAPTVNAPDCVAAASAAAVAALGESHVEPDADPIMASEDFGVFAQQVPGCLIWLGNGTEPGAGGTPLHSQDYDFNDEILAAGISYYASLVRRQLP